jgi:hypothetical protein
VLTWTTLPCAAAAKARGKSADGAEGSATRARKSEALGAVLTIARARLKSLDDDIAHLA